MTRMLRAFPALCLAVLAGCGSSVGGSGSDTATLAPPTSFLYAEATIDPSGDQESAMRSILGDLPGEGAPEDRLHALLQKASESAGSKVDYTKDVKPWLGEKASVFVTQGKAGAGSPAWGVVIATSDAGKAQDAIDRGGKGPNRSYRDVDYKLDDGAAMGIVGGYFVAGSEAGMKAAIDASKGESLSEADRYKEAVAKAEDDRVALVYEDLGGIVQALASTSGESLGPAGPLLGRVFGGKPVVATIKAEQQALVIDGSLVPSGTVGNLFGKTTPLLGELPESSWLAMGQADLGNSIKSVIGLFAGFAGGQQALEQQLRAQTGLDLQRDILSWVGDVAFFVRGDTKETLGGGALIQSEDPRASERALTKLAALVARGGGGQVAAAKIGGGSGYRLTMDGVPQPVFMVQSGERVAIAYGEPAAREALAPSAGPMGFADASRRIGEAYALSLMVSVPPILKLAESFGASGGDWEQARGYLTILDDVISGSAKSGDTAKSRTRISFKPHE